MSSNTNTPKNGSSEREAPKGSKNQLQPSYPKTLDFAQANIGDRANASKTNTSPRQQYVGSSTGSSSSSSSSGKSDFRQQQLRQQKQAAYRSVERPWGKTPPWQNDTTRSGAVDYNPMSKWERGDVVEEPWNGVGKVLVADGPWAGNSRSGRRRAERKDSECATKGSDQEAGSDL